ncbi:olfactory receptor 51J1-like [Perognathus longimembris pacificus]|uniref:olfactory receptor 51J1-like n=1 Tax=Perognathus longimembris pacificus TaxID=214514 RepID=UPI002019647B|nr:olfactory receptor 51J1-like [Perognathus longimembris pacificus]
MKNSSSLLGDLPTTFILAGIPGLETEHIWLSIPFCLMYTIIFLGNGAILHIIRIDAALHRPMYLFLAMLAVAEVGVSVSTLPTVLGMFLLGNSEIHFEACLLQMFCIHSFSIMESAVLLAMSVDRFVAIYSPLRYTTILTLPRIVCTGAVIGLKSIVLMAPLPLLLRRLPFCGHNTLSHSYCLHPNLIHLPCGDTSINNIYGLFIVISTFGLDSLLIVVSYALILHTVLGIATGEGRKKALNTCGSHVCAVLAYYVPMIGLSMVHRFGHHVSPLLQVMMANAYLFFPPVINPIVYSIKTKEIRRGIVRMLSEKRSRV